MAGAADNNSFAYADGATPVSGISPGVEAAIEYIASGIPRALVEAVVNTNFPDSLPSSDAVEISTPPGAKLSGKGREGSTWYATDMPNPEGVDYLISLGLDIRRLGFASAESASKFNFEDVIQSLKSLVLGHDRKLYTQMSANTAQKKKIGTNALVRAVAYIADSKTSIVGYKIAADGRKIFQHAEGRPKPLKESRLLDLQRPNPEGVDYLATLNADILRRCAFKSIEDAKLVEFGEVVRRLRALTGQDKKLRNAMSMGLARGKLSRNFLDRAVVNISAHDISVLSCFIAADGRCRYKLSNVQKTARKKSSKKKCLKASAARGKGASRFVANVPSPEGVDYLTSLNADIFRRCGFESMEDAKQVEFGEVVRRLRALTRQDKRLFKTTSDALGRGRVTLALLGKLVLQIQENHHSIVAHSVTSKGRSSYRINNKRGAPAASSAAAGLPRVTEESNKFSLQEPSPEGVDYLISLGLDMSRLKFGNLKRLRNAYFGEICGQLAKLITGTDEGKILSRAHLDESISSGVLARAVRIANERVETPLSLDEFGGKFCEAIQHKGFSYAKLGYFNIDVLYNASARDILIRIAMITKAQVEAHPSLSSKGERLDQLVAKLKNPGLECIKYGSVNKLLALYDDTNDPSYLVKINRDGPRLKVTREELAEEFRPQLRSEKMRAKPEINPDHYVSEDEAKNLRDRIGLNMGQGETVERVLYNLQSYMVDWMGYQREAVIDVLADICSFYYYGSPLPKEAAKTLGNILNDMQAEGYKAPTVDSVLRRRAEQMGCSELDGMIDSAIADQLNKTTYSKKIIPFDELPVAERLAVMERAIARGQFGGLRAKFQPG